MPVTKVSAPPFRTHDSYLVEYMSSLILPQGDLLRGRALLSHIVI